MGRRSDLDDDPTPRGVPRAVLAAAVMLDSDGLPYVGCSDDPFEDSGQPLGDAFGRRPVRVLDLGAGYGCWSSEMRRLAHEQGWPVHITAVELNPDREPDLRKWCDDVVSDDWRFTLIPRVGRDYTTLDLIIGNPPFAELLRKDGEFPVDEHGALDPEQTMVGIALRHAPAVLFLHTQQAFLKSAMGRAVQRAYPPAACWQIPGSVGFRGDGRADSRCYEATLWLRDHTGPCSRYLLPELAAEDRRWTVPPGSESPAEAEALGLPLAPGYTPC